jgi:Holliday junction resolvase RusA-like endonuclease
MTLVFSIPTPPSTNHLFRTAGARRVKTDPYKAWLTEAGWEIRRQRVPLTLGPVAVTLTVQRLTRGGRADIDNRIKAALDLLVKQCVIGDDDQVQEITARWGAVEGCRVEIRQISDGGISAPLSQIMQGLAPKASAP